MPQMQEQDEISEQDYNFNWKKEDMCILWIFL